MVLLDQATERLKKMLSYQSILFMATILPSVYLSAVYKNKMRGTEYDYIIVGAGTAGSVLANRLSEDSSTKVLVLEAGHAPTGITEIPLTLLELDGSPMNWGYATEPQENACLGLKERRSNHPRGKALGGSSVINGMQYVRGERRDFDEWAKGGATGWNWDNILHYFKKAEDQKSSEFSKTGHYGVHGYQTVSVPEFATPLREAYFKAMDYLGYSMVDINSGSPVGYSKVQATIRDGLRCSQEKAFLRPAASRENLDILTGAHVVKILFDENKRARSVRFEQNDITLVVSTRKEIILSAGVYGSAQILLLSGIGPKEHLDSLKIPVIADLPVGENLQDHICTNGLIYLTNQNMSLNPLRFLNYESLGLLFEGKGPLTVPVATECLAVLNTKFQMASENWPDLRLIFVSLVVPPTKDEEEIAGRDSFTILPMVARPKSTGYVRLRSTDPYDHPVINPKYLSHEEDLKILVEGIKLAEEIVGTPVFQELGAVRYPQVIPGCENLDTKDDDYWKCMARRLSQTNFHQCCTCKMGDPRDPTTVVDPELRIKGVRGLRVADASIMPAVTSGNTMAPCIMIGERAADLIKGRYWDARLNKMVEISK